MVADLVEYGNVQRAFMGLSIQDIDSRFATEKQIKQLRGVYINGITANGAAEAVSYTHLDVYKRQRQLCLSVDQPL